MPQWSRPRHGEQTHCRHGGATPPTHPLTRSRPGPGTVKSTDILSPQPFLEAGGLLLRLPEGVLQLEAGQDHDAGHGPEVPLRVPGEEICQM